MDFELYSKNGMANRMDLNLKEKACKDKEKASIRLYSYPVLMAADILLYDASHVPGEIKNNI